ncbi:MAG: transposase [Candidatus Acidiferrales bacterium]
MDSKKYIGMDVHKESISIAVRNGAGKIVMECVIETKASMILQFIEGLRGDLQVTFEEGTSAAWLYDLLKPHVTKLVVCDPRKNASMREGNQNDRIDARRLAELLRLHHLHPVYHGEHGLRSLKELVRSYLTITKDLGRVMTRVKAIYRSWAIPCSGKQVYAPRHRAEWLGKITEPGVRRRAEFYYQQLDALRTVRQQVRRELLAEGQKHQAWKRLRQIPSIGPIRSAVLLGILQTPHRFRSKRQLAPAYLGFFAAIVGRSQSRSGQGALRRAESGRTSSLRKAAARLCRLAQVERRQILLAVRGRARKPSRAHLRQSECSYERTLYAVRLRVSNARMNAKLQRGSGKWGKRERHTRLDC